MNLSCLGPSTSSPIAPSLATVDEIITFSAGPAAPNVIQIRINITDDLVALEATESYVTSLQILGSPANVEIGLHPTTLVDVLDNDRKLPHEMSTSLNFDTNVALCVPKV